MILCSRNLPKKGKRVNPLTLMFVLLRLTETKIVVIMNCRELLHFFQQRCCSRAQWKIRTLVDEMLIIAKK
ncbi:MAG: hypothetical protein GX554_02395 [Elusimicrobia bacterium]|nr:hypothetical protein [Elusimicrobiota bacterium]